MFSPYEYSIIEATIGPGREERAGRAYQQEIALAARKSTPDTRYVHSVRRTTGYALVRAGYRLAGVNRQLEMSNQ
jgi:hypothetical protein